MGALPARWTQHFSPDYRSTSNRTSRRMHLPLSQIAQCPMRECELVHVCRDQISGKCVRCCRYQDTGHCNRSRSQTKISALCCFWLAAESAAAIAEEIERLWRADVGGLRHQR